MGPYGTIRYHTGPYGTIASYFKLMVLFQTFFDRLTHSLTDNGSKYDNNLTKMVPKLRVNLKYKMTPEW